MSYLSTEEYVKNKVAREILSMIEQVYFSEEFREYRINYGTNGQRDLIINNIKETYGVG